MDNYLAIKDLKVSFSSFSGLKNILDIKELNIRKGQSYGLVGESGAGKSVLALTILRLLTVPPAMIESGSICLAGEDLLRKTERQMTHIRGNRVAMIFQDPMSTLNPVFTVGEQINEVIRHNLRLDKKAAQKKSLEMIELVRLPDAANILGKYPHELSGGQRQRIIIAIALSCGAEFLIADEPTRNLDVTIQAGILKLLAELQKELKVTVLFIANNLSLVSIICNQVGLLYKGGIVEEGSVRDVIGHPLHPYTKTLLKPLPEQEEEKQAVRMTLAEDAAVLDGCAYRHKCISQDCCCAELPPPMIRMANGQIVACHQYGEGGMRHE